MKTEMDRLITECAKTAKNHKQINLKDYIIIFLSKIINN
jgi:hypothetical protein